ncbi:MAG: hypothetical protein H7249_20905 [Chitinophagaceae bacterium]|nr:hypothetical protein [Oligoflexus sp.]
MTKRFLIACGLSLLLAAPAQGAIDLAQLRQAEKISISLTGKPLSADLRAKFIAGQLTLPDLAENLSHSQGFVEYFAQFWSRLIGVQGPVDIDSIKAVNAKDAAISFRDRFNLTDWLGIDKRKDSTADINFLTAYIKNHKTTPMEINIIECPDGPLIVGAGSSNMIAQFKRAAVDQLASNLDVDLPILPGTQPYWQQLLDIATETSATCTDPVTTVKPWWDPVTITLSTKYPTLSAYKVVPKVLERCGKNMELCNLRSAPQYNRYMNQVAYDLSMEPGYIISHTVAEDKPFSDVLTTQSTVVTGTYAHFMGHNGVDLWNNYPGGKIADQTNSIFTTGDVNDRSHHWINRGPLNAGVLTTPAFQLVTNGLRAKANRTYETFLCKKFTVPDGAQANPLDANPDLTKRAYCQYCHKSIEPMAAFFNRWPVTGVNNFIFYNNQTPDGKTPNDTGRFNGSEGVGVPAFGKIVTETDTFDECSVRRAFEFVNGRKMSAIELDNILPGYVGDFRANQKNLRSILKAMVLKPEFLAPKAGDQ